MNTALIIEDDFIIALLLRNQLEKLGLTVAGTLDNGEELSEQVDRTRPDVLFVDIELKGDLNGMDAVRQLSRENRPHVIFITGASVFKTRRETEDIAPVSVLGKPVSFSDIEQTVEKLEKISLSSQLA